METAPETESNSSPYSVEVDTVFMRQAIQLASRGIGTTSPNPPVGAVVVYQTHDCIYKIGAGYHEKAGQPHAERRALANARDNGYGDMLKSATLYVTLEPCSSYGRTPPCTEAILEAGIGRVVFGSTDPDKRHQGRAVEILEAAGVQVVSGFLQDECDELLRPWRHAVEQGRPWVLAKVATTLDARMTRPTERWLSGPESLSFVHGLRAWSDAILVGGQTVRADDPALTIRTPNVEVPAIKEQPWRVVLTHDKNSLPADAKIFSDEHAARTLVYENVGDLAEFLHRLYKEQGVVHLMLECGGKLLRQFLEASLVDEWVQIITPTICGGPNELVPGDFLPKELRFEQESVTWYGRDLVLRGTLQ